MYVPDHFKIDEASVLKQYIGEYGFGLLITAYDSGIDAHHVPFLLDCGDDESLGILQCHVARKNGVWQRLVDGGRVLAVFQGSDAYISPSWYPTKAEHGRVVPTWNYLAVHAEGSARTVEDPAWLHRHLHQLVDRHESGMKEPWSMDDAPSDYTGRLMQAIVGIEITIEVLTGKLKASQNQPERNRKGVKAGLEAGDGAHSLAMSRFID